MKKSIQQLFDKGFLQIGELEGKEIYHLTTPCRFNISKEVVENLINNYLTEEEIGGILWAKPTIIGKEKVYLIDQVKFLRNAIEDSPYRDKGGILRTRKNSYLRDEKSYTEELKKIFSKGYLPVKFHTHPTKGTNPIENSIKQLLHTETSGQDQRESKTPTELDNKFLVMPRALIVGNGDLKNNIFIGLYDGSIAPVSFEDSKKKVIEERIGQFADAISSTNLSDKSKFLLSIGAFLLILGAVKYPKVVVPAILGLLATAPILLSNTANLNKVSYYNKLSVGEANIYIPAKEF